VETNRTQGTGRKPKGPGGNNDLTLIMLGRAWKLSFKRNVELFSFICLASLGIRTTGGEVASLLVVSIKKAGKEKWYLEREQGKKRKYNHTGGVSNERPLHVISPKTRKKCNAHVKLKR